MTTMTEQTIQPRPNSPLKNPLTRRHFLQFGGGAAAALALAGLGVGGTAGARPCGPRASLQVGTHCSGSPYRP